MSRKQSRALGERGMKAGVFACVFAGRMSRGVRLTCRIRASRTEGLVSGSARTERGGPQQQVRPACVSPHPLFLNLTASSHTHTAGLNHTQTQHHVNVNVGLTHTQEKTHSSHQRSTEGCKATVREIITSLSTNEKPISTALLLPFVLLTQPATLAH